MKNVVIIKIRDKNGDVVAVDEIALPGDTADGMTATITTIKVRPRPHKDAGRSPLHPNALALTDLRVGMRIHVHYTGSCPWVRSYSAVVVGKPTTNDLGFQTIPIVTDDMEYKMGFVADMGLAPSRCGGIWNSSWYTVAAE